jgi:transposase
MRFYTQQHPFYCGIDLHARTRSLGILHRAGASLLHRNMPAGPAPVLKAIAPYREDVVVWVAWIFTWYGRADLCAREGWPFVLGPALYMQAIPGGKATNDQSDAQNIAGLLRGGTRPQASVAPAAMRAPRARLRRRFPLTRKRAELLAHLQNTTSPSTRPAIGKTLASKAHRGGGAERFPDPAVHQSVAGDLALLDFYDQLRRAVALTIVQTAQQHDAQALYRRPSVPGIGKIVRLVLLYEMQDITRFPRVQDFVSSCRLGTCAQEAAGQR